MAPTLLGPHYRAHCRHCGYAFAVAAESCRPELPTRCPGCGGPCELDDVRRPGERVRLATVDASRQPLQRFDVIAFTDPHTQRPHVKRIWGLPGERVQLRAGELYLGPESGGSPRLLQKTLAELRRVCVPLSDFPVDARGGRQWWIDGRLLSAVPPALPAAPDVELEVGQSLRWCPMRAAAIHPHERGSHEWLVPGPVTDDYEVNQGVSCVLHSVSDLLLELQLARPLTAPLTIVGHLPDGVQQVQFIPVESRSPTSGELPPVAAKRAISVAWCDRRLLVETDVAAGQWDSPPRPSPPDADRGRVVAAGREATSDQRGPAGADVTPPAWIEICCQGPLHVTNLRVSRDLYLPDWQPAADATLDGYFVLGDNLPVSIDSRSELGRIEPDNILGRVAR